MEKLKMNTRSLRVTIPILLAVLLLGCITPVLATVPLPMTVYGHVYVDGTSAGAGLNVYAKHGTDIVTQDTTDSESYYMLSISPTSGLDDGTPIDLWVEEHNVTRITLAYWGILEVDLTISAVTPPENEPPVADPNGPYTGTEGQQVTFDGSASTDPDGTIVSYDWDFGDLSTGTGVNPSHTYAQNGTYTVTLTVTDDDGATDTDTTTATIADTEPTADFSGTPTTGAPPLSVSFTDESTAYDNIVSWSWTFGDGETSTDQNPTHTYDTEGTYTVTLTISEADYDTDIEEKPDYINVTTALVPDFTITVNPTSGPVLQGESTTPTVTITSIDGYSETVSLSASGQPTNVSVSFNPTSSTPTFTSTMTINVEDAEPGPYTITITGTGADTTTHTTPYILTVIERYVHTETVTDSGTVNATGADTTVDIDATGNHTITVSKYESNPGTGFAGDTGKYIDVHLDDPTNVTEIEIRLYYTDAEIAGLVESSLRMHWCNGTDWVTCCTTGVNTTDTDGYSGYMWVRITSETTPSLTDLTGTPFGAAGEGTERPVGGIFGYVNRLYLLVYMNQWLITGILMLIAGICTVLYWRKQKTA